MVHDVVVANSVHSPMIVVGTDDPSTSASTQLLIFGYAEETRLVFCVYTCTYMYMYETVHSVNT